LKTNTEKIEAAAKKKDEGNVWFKMGKYAKASKRYEKVKWQWQCTQDAKYLLLLSNGPLLTPFSLQSGCKIH